MLTPREYEDRVFHVAGGELQIVGGDGGCKSGSEPPFEGLRASRTPKWARSQDAAIARTWGTAVLRPYKGEPKSTVPSGLPSKIGAGRVDKPPFDAQGKPFGAQGKPFEAQGKPFEAQGKQQ